MLNANCQLQELVTLEVPKRGQLRDPLVPQECPQGVLDAMRACMQVRAAGASLLRGRQASIA